MYSFSNPLVLPNFSIVLEDFDCFQGVSGVVTFLKETRKGYEELGTMNFDGIWPIKEEA